MTEAPALGRSGGQAVGALPRRVRLSAFPPFRLLCVLASLRLCVLPALAVAQTPKLHHLPATPATVAWGYYSAAAKPALRVASGDIVEVETLLTSTPERLEAAGVPKDQVESSLRAITTTVTDKGPGGHILTGPVYVEGAEPGDVLEVHILSVTPAT